MTADGLEERRRTAQALDIHSIQFNQREDTSLLGSRKCKTIYFKNGKICCSAHLFMQNSFTSLVLLLLSFSTDLPLAWSSDYDDAQIATGKNQ